jgi:hypothetical protein
VEIYFHIIIMSACICPMSGDHKYQQTFSAFVCDAEKINADI